MPDLNDDMSGLAICVAAFLLALWWSSSVRRRWAVRDAEAAAYARTTASGIDFFGLDAAGRAALSEVAAGKCSELPGQRDAERSEVVG